MFEELIHRRRDASQWLKIPWDEPEFSRRMLREHLSQEHDAASRRAPLIDQSVEWIHQIVLEGKPSCILDLGCGPGFYTHRFVRLGHTCTGIDFGPASIAYAREHHDGNFVLGDVVTTEYGAGYDLVCMIYGELNAFSPRSAEQIVEKAYDALKPGGVLLLEVMEDSAVRQMGAELPSWHTADRGLWSDDPYLVLQEASSENNRSCSWYYVIDAASGEMAQYVAMHQAYSLADYNSLLRRFSQIEQVPSLTGDLEGDGVFFALVARK